MWINMVARRIIPVFQWKRVVQQLKLHQKILIHHSMLLDMMPSTTFVAPSALEMRRPRNSGWPTSETISEVVHKGCHVVYVQHRAFRDYEGQWSVPAPSLCPSLSLSLSFVLSLPPSFFISFSLPLSLIINNY